MKPPQIHLTIDRLVLGLPDLAPGDVPRLVAALEHELARLLADGPPLGAGHSHFVRAADLSPGTGTDRDPGALGRDLARSLARALGGAA